MSVSPPARRSIDPRRSFLARHLAEALGRRDDILALDDIEKRLRSAAAGKAGGFLNEHQSRQLDYRIDACSWISPHRFFYESEKTLQVYFPVGIMDVELKRFYRSLTHLLAANKSSPRGIVLRASSGSGKTLASFRALFDCFFCGQQREGDKLVPTENLFGHLPCWLHLDQLPVSDALSEEMKKNVVPRLLLQAAGWSHEFPDVSCALRWLEAGPPLLIFCDLDVLDVNQRTDMAAALREFSVHYPGLGHRIVVAYRTGHIQDAVFGKLGRVFRLFDLQPLPRSQASEYLTNIHQYEARVAEEFKDLSLPSLSDKQIEEVRRTTLQMIDRYAGREESLISTPMLMHFVSQQLPGELPDLQSVSDLYHKVVRQHLERDHQLYQRDFPSGFQGTEGLRRVRVAMVRLALAMHVKRDIRLNEIEVNQLLAAPTQAADLLADGHAADRSANSLWNKPDVSESLYYTDVYLPNERSFLKRFSLLKVEGQAFRFLHDSFVDYFVGAGGLGEYRGPDEPPPARASRFRTGAFPADWYAGIVDLWRHDPVRWRKAAGFLSGTLDPHELRELVGRWLMAEPNIGHAWKWKGASEAWFDLLVQMIEGRPLISDMVLDTIQLTLRSRAPWPNKCPEMVLDFILDDLTGSQRTLA